MQPILILKTAALGDVLRTTSILPGLRARQPHSRTTWVTAPEAVDLLRHHPLVHEVVPFQASSPQALNELSQRLGATTWERVLSLDEEEACCRLASRLPTKSLSGAWFDERALVRRYTPDVAPWFDMGLLSVLGKRAADGLKRSNRLSHAQIFARMLGVRDGKPELALDADSEGEGAALRERLEGSHPRPWIGLNTGAGGRWISKALPVERVIALTLALHAALSGKVSFLLFGGPAEAGRNREIAAGLAGKVHLADTGCDNPLLRFAAFVSLCDLLIVSDSLALHVAVARGVRTVAFFAPTPAAEIDLFGCGEKVESTAPDAGSYRPDADTSTLTVDRLRDAALRQLDAR
jgi:ADP-heptose:LPS heptosyltransferase